MRPALCCLLAMIVVGGVAISQPASDVLVLRVQTVGDVTYFQVRLKLPEIEARDSDEFEPGWSPAPRARELPRLITNDPTVRQIALNSRDESGPNRFGGRPAFGDKIRWDKFEKDRRPPLFEKDKAPERKEFDKGPEKDKDGPLLAERTPHAEFFGRCDGKSKVTFTFQYPTPGKRSALGKVLGSPPQTVWVEKAIVLDFANAKKLGSLEQPKPWVRPRVNRGDKDFRGDKKGEEKRFDRDKDGKREKDHFEKKEEFKEERREPIDPRNNLSSLWANAQSEQLDPSWRSVSESGFQEFASSLLQRKYMPDQLNRTPWQEQRDWRRGEDWRFERPSANSRLYDLTSGATAMSETLALRRMRRIGIDSNQERVIAVEKLPRIEIAEHPWKEMMGEKKPAPEPMAQLVPNDNYYVRFNRIDKMAAFAQVLGAWGGNLMNFYEMSNTDGRYWQRYERQLCLNLESLAKPLKDAVSEVALTGSDAYLREGSDMTVLFRVKDAATFSKAITSGIDAVKKEYTDPLNSSESEHLGVKISSLQSALREVSLHRATIDDVEIFSNSLIAVHRVIESAKEKRKRLGDSLDFQYMRTVFRADDKSEDGFAFLSDAFIRNLVGPATKIKQRRRFEALASLHMMTQGAMFVSWDTGKMPISTKDLYTKTTLTEEDLPMPEGKAATWNSKERVAISESYGTIHFATPLIELPITKVTNSEAEEYRSFHMEYLGLWRQFFDPMGFRVSMDGNELKFDTYILPLIENTAYNQLRRIVGKGTVKLQPERLSSKTLLQFMMHITNDANDREEWFRFGPGFGPRRGPGFGPEPELGTLLWLAWAFDPLGEWFLLRADDSPAWGKLYKLAMRQRTRNPVSTEEIAREIWSLPLAVGVDLKNSLTIAASLAALRTTVMTAAPGFLTWGPLEKEYNGVAITKIEATERGAGLLTRIDGRPNRFQPAIFYAVIDGGLFVTLNEEMMKRLIDDSKGKKDPKGKSVDVATSLHLSPGAAVDTRVFLKALLQTAVAENANAAYAPWEVLYTTGVISPKANRKDAENEAYRFLGYVPSSPDGSAFKWDTKNAEIVNEQFGSRRQPKTPKGLLETSKVNQLFESIETIRADLKFREDGIHTVLNMKWKK